MVTAANNIDFLFWPLKMASIRMDDPFEKKRERFLVGMRRDLFSSKFALKYIITEKLPAIFELRLEALKWYQKEKINFADLLINEVYPYLEQMRRLKRLSQLADHIKDALEWNKKLAASLERSQQAIAVGFRSFDVPEISFEQVISEIYLSCTRQDEAETNIDLIKCSLHIEYIIVAASLINDEKLLVNENKIIELSSTLAETIQAYISLAGDLHLIPANQTIHAKSKNNSKGAAAFSKMLNDKKLIQAHLRSGGELSDLKDNFNFVNPLSFTTQ